MQQVTFKPAVCPGRPSGEVRKQIDWARRVGRSALRLLAENLFVDRGRE